MKTKLVFSLALWLMIQPLASSAQMYGPPPGYEGMQAPSQAEIDAMMRQAQEQAQAQMGQPPAGMPAMDSQRPNFPGGQIPEGLQLGAGAPSKEQIEEMMKSGQMPANVAGFDLSKMEMPKMEGGMAPNFAGVKLDASNPMVAKLGEVLDRINDQLTQAEEDTKELSEGQIEGADNHLKTLKQARAKYNEARQAFTNGDYQAVGQLLNAMPKPPKPEELVKLGISLDLINDIRVKLKKVLSEIDQKIEDPAEASEAKAEISLALTRLDEAEAKFKKGDKKGAQTILAELKKNAPDAEALEAGGDYLKIPVSKLGKIIDMIGQKIEQGEKHLATAKSQGIDISEAKATMDKIKELYSQAKAALETGDTKLANEKLKAIKSLEPEKYFGAFSDKVMPKERIIAIIKEASDGVKALKLTIKHAQDYGMSTIELEQLLAELEPLVNKADTAFKAGNKELCLQYLVMAKQLNTNEAVNKIIKATAEKRAQELLSKALPTVAGGIDDLEAAFTAIGSAKLNTGQAQKILTQAKETYQEAQALYDTGKYMEAGRKLEDTVQAFQAMINLIKDLKVKLSSEQQTALATAVASARQTRLITDTKLSGQAKDLVNAVPLELSNSLAEFDPAIIDQTISMRSKDKALIDNIMRDVMPLIPEADRQATMEGKLGLLEELKSADKTLAQMKSMKGIQKEALSLFDEVRQLAKNYNFSPEKAVEVEAMLADFDDKLQSGELKDTKLVIAYAKTLNAEIKTAIKEDNADKFKNKEIPAHNIDSNHRLFNDVSDLVADGALKADAKGNIELDKKIDKAVLAQMINQTIDNEVIKATKGQASLTEIIKLITQAYGIKIDSSKPADLITTAKSLGLDIKIAELKNQATVGQAIILLSGADQRWGTTD